VPWRPEQLTFITVPPCLLCLPSFSFSPFILSIKDPPNLSVLPPLPPRNRRKRDRRCDKGCHVANVAAFGTSKATTVVIVRLMESVMVTHAVISAAVELVVSDPVMLEGQEMEVVLRKGKKGVEGLVGIAVGVVVAFANGGRLKFTVVLLVTIVTTNVVSEAPEEKLKVAVGVAVVLVKSGLVELVNEAPRTATSAATVVLGVTRLVTVANVVGWGLMEMDVVMMLAVDVLFGK
jgi:hypothetical protein